MSFDCAIDDLNAECFDALGDAATYLTVAGDRRCVRVAIEHDTEVVNRDVLVRDRKYRASLLECEGLLPKRGDTIQQGRDSYVVDSVDERHQGVLRLWVRKS